MHPLSSLFRAATAATMLVAFAGCATTLALHPDSPIPKRWASDPRIKGWGPIHIVYSCQESSGEVTATISSPSLNRHFTAKGTSRWGASDEVVASTPAKNLPIIYEFDGLAERYRVIYVPSKRNPEGEAFLYLAPK